LEWPTVHRSAHQFPGSAGSDKNKARAVTGQIARVNIAEDCLVQARLAEFNNEAGKMEGLLGKAAESQPGNYRARIALASYCLSAARGNRIENGSAAGARGKGRSRRPDAV
jgi:hypothetical protein